MMKAARKASFVQPIEGAMYFMTSLEAFSFYRRPIHSSQVNVDVEGTGVSHSIISHAVQEFHHKASFSIESELAELIFVDVFDSRVEVKLFSLRSGTPRFYKRFTYRSALTWLQLMATDSDHRCVSVSDSDVATLQRILNVLALTVFRSRVVSTSSKSLECLQPTLFLVTSEWKEYFHHLLPLKIDENDSLVRFLNGGVEVIREAKEEVKQAVSA